MAEYTEAELIERREVDPPTEPDERGWTAYRATKAVYRTTTLITDVDDSPLGVSAETGVVDSVSYLPPDSPRWARLAAERAEREANDA